jgi:hypothetical protein
VAISEPATAHFTAYKNLENISIAYKPMHTHTHRHPETLEGLCVNFVDVCIMIFGIYIFNSSIFETPDDG